MGFRYEKGIYCTQGFLVKIPRKKYLMGWVWNGRLGSGDMTLLQADTHALLSEVDALIRLYTGHCRNQTRISNPHQSRFLACPKPSDPEIV